MHLLLQVWNEIIADQKLGKLGESKFIHMTVNGGGIVMFTPTLRCECAQPYEWSINAKIMYRVSYNFNYVSEY